MAGEKMDFAKKAANGIIDKLSPQDFVSIVMYDEYIDVIQPATAVLHKDSIKARIAKIKPRNSTNLWGGSEKGYEQVKANYRPNCINRVLLISDGVITAGIKIPSRIITKVQEYKDIEGITISTFGVGLDYNETLMTDMAENGAGNYYFIDRADKMTAMFNKELNGLLNVVAQNAELRITLPKGVTVEKVYPFKYAQVKNELVIRYRDLFSEESKGLLVQFRLDDNVDKELRFQSKLSFTDAVDNQPKAIVIENLLVPVKNREAYLTYFNKRVAEQVLLFTANENMERAMQEADKGNYEAARRFAEANGYFFSNNATYVNGSGELRKMDSVNRFYSDDLSRAKSMSADSVKLLQKSRRALNYQIRSKKQ
jgi:Ca-activated chloride channel homolog